MIQGVYATYLYCFGKDTDPSKTFTLPEKSKFHVDLIDTWNMTIEERGSYSGRFTIVIPENQYIAIRIYKIK
ncbi:MAG: DUF5605 domain-containing protein [Bacteroidota bacterium]